MAGQQSAHAQETAPASAEVDSGDLDGFYIALGPVASAVCEGGAWDGGFGGEISLVRVRERGLLTALGVGLGAVRFARAARDDTLGGGIGRAWADVQLGISCWPGPACGIGAGLAAEIDSITPPRWGAQATFWIFMGVIPFIRIGTVQKDGAYIDFGIKVALPAVRI
ncbi:MAG: hypothetical protein MJE77_20180 [Proteobacteria bacterium]|nr:hypothetical protein [Pseudomonadota bacterium]